MRKIIIIISTLILLLSMGSADADDPDYEQLYNDLLSDYNSLNNSHNSLIILYNNINTSYNELLIEYTSLNVSYNSQLLLTADIQLLYNNLFDSYNSVLSDHQTNLNDLQSTIDVKSDIINKLQEHEVELTTELSFFVLENEVLKDERDDFTFQITDLTTQLNDPYRFSSVYLCLGLIIGVIALIMFGKYRGVDFSKFSDESPEGEYSPEHRESTMENIVNSIKGYGHLPRDTVIKTESKNVKVANGKEKEIKKDTNDTLKDLMRGKENIVIPDFKDRGMSDAETKE